MGLLDNDPETTGLSLYALGAGLLGNQYVQPGMPTGAAWGRGMTSGLQGLLGVQNAQAMNKYRKLQADQMQAEMDDKARQRAQSEAWRNYLRGQSPQIAAGPGAQLADAGGGNLFAGMDPNQRAMLSNLPDPLFDQAASKYVMNQIEPQKTEYIEPGKIPVRGGQAVGAPIGEKPKKAPQTRTIPRGGIEVAQEFDEESGKWVDIPGAQGPRWRPESTEIVIGPNGQPILVRGGAKGVQQALTGLTPASQNKAQDKLMTAGDTLALLEGVKSTFKPEYQQLGARWQNLVAAGKDRLGMASPEEQSALKDFSTYRATAAQLFSQTLKDMSGLAVNPTEFKRAEAWLPNPGTGLLDGDSPTELSAKAERFIDFTKKAIAKYHYINRAGLSLDSVDVDRMPSIIRERGNELAKKYESNGLKGDALKKAVKRQLGAEFGMAVD